MSFVQLLLFGLWSIRYSIIIRYTYMCFVSNSGERKKTTYVRNGADSLVYYCPSPEPLINNVDLLDFHFGICILYTHTYTLNSLGIHPPFDIFSLFFFFLCISISFTPICAFLAAHEIVFVSAIYLPYNSLPLPSQDWTATAIHAFAIRN